jgi:uncharacterized protein (UPF0333 family)
MGKEDREEIGNGAKIGRGKVEMTLFGIKIEDLSKEFKLLVAAITIFLIVIGMIYGLRRIRSFDRQVKAKIKKDKKK